MRIKVLFLTFSLAMFNSFSSCKKEGCTDLFADNYDEKAKTEDGSCQYSGTVSFWYNQTSAQNMQADDILSLTIYVDNNVIGSYATNVFFPVAPNCGQSSVVSKTMDLGSSRTKNTNYIILDNNGDLVWAGNVTFDASVACTRFELTY